jgi:hypothetical protein
MKQVFVVSFLKGFLYDSEGIGFFEIMRKRGNFKKCLEKGEIKREKGKR